MAEWISIAAALVGAAGMGACLYAMYGDRKNGFPALCALDSRFSSLDMRKSYTPQEVFACLEGVGPEGQKLLVRLWKIDFAFIFFFLLVMALITRNLALAPWMAAAMLVAAVLRAVLDSLENLLLLSVCRAYPKLQKENAAKAAGLATRLKWAAMGLWLAGLFISLMIRAIGMSA